MAQRPAGLLVRRFGVVALVGIPLFGVLTYHGVLLAGLTDIPLTVAILTVVSVPIVLALILVTARELDRAYVTIDASRELARALFEESADGVFVADLNGRYIDVNAAGCRLVGAPRDVILGLTIADLVAPGEQHRIALARSELLAGIVHTAEWNLRRLDGTFVTVEVSAKILPDGRWQGIVRDITQRKAAEEAARRSEARLDGIISMAADAIISLDEQQRIVMFNSGAERIFGWTRDEILGRPIGALIPPRFRAVHADHVQRFAQESPTARMMSERQGVSGIRKNGEEFPAEAAISRLDQAGASLFTVFLRDVTATRKLQEELRRHIAARDEILSIVAHDLRGPLAAVRFGADILSRQLPDELRQATSRPVEAIRASIRQATRLVDDLLDVARIDAGSLRIMKVDALPKTIVDRVIEQFAPRVADASIELEGFVDPSIPVVRLDEGRVQQVLANLVDNAIKFTPHGGRVRISLTRRDDQLVFAVTDSGQGIPPEHMDHLFDRFWQGEHRRHGAGLGLAISKGIVESHGGRISATSVPGQGSTFEFTLPVEYGSVAASGGLGSIGAA